jgi:adenylate cyclase
MTDWIADLTSQTQEIFSTAWESRGGTVIPESEDVALKNGAVKVSATFLYADLAASSKLAEACPWGTTAKIIRAYLNCCTRLIIAYGGKIRSFDGDRVMGVFMGDTKNSYAASCGREIFWVTEKVIAPKATATFDSIKNNNIKISQCVGIDTGDAIAVRAGVRNNNDLIWIGRPPSLAAKLSDIRETNFGVYISDNCFKKLNDANKVYDGTNLWEGRSFKFADEDKTVYRTSWMKKP